MTQRIDIPAGAVFNRLTVIGRDWERARVHWICRCRCGSEVSVQSTDLRSGHTKSCGCHRADVSRMRETTHGQSKTATYDIWAGMIGRCTNPNDSVWEYYGGRGIKVCRRWRKFENFFADMGERPTGRSLDRKNNDQGYSPGNCHWATKKQQANNRRPRRWRKRPANTSIQGAI